METLRTDHRISHLRLLPRPRELRDDGRLNDRDDRQKAFKPKRRRPREVSVPGVPGLRKVESLKNPAVWTWIHRYHDRAANTHPAITYGTSVEISFSEAVARAHRERAMLARGLNPKGATLTLDCFVETVVTPWARGNLRSWKDLESRYRLYFTESLGAMQVNEISAADVERVLIELRKPGKSQRRKRLKAATVNRAAMALRTIFRLAKLQGLIDNNPLDGWHQLRESPPPPLALTLDEVRRLLERLQSEPERFRLLVELLLETAMRINEALQARFQDVDAERRVLHLALPKSGEPEEVPLSARALKIIQRLRDLSPNDWLFPAARGDGHMYAPRKALKCVFESLAVHPSACWHTLRKSVATIASENGVSIYAISKLLRHRSIRVTERHYLASTTDQVRHVVSVVSEVMRNAGDASDHVAVRRS